MSQSNEKDSDKENIRFRPLTKWKPREADKYATYDGGIFIMRFERAFIDKDNIIQKYDRFLIKKASYEKQLKLLFEIL